MTAALLLFTLSPPSHASSEQVDLVISTWCGPPVSTPEQTGYLDQVLHEAFSRLGSKVQIIRAPAERSLQNANNGLTDGEFIRISKIGELYPNLLIVPEPLYTMEFVAFTTLDDITLDNGWASLAPYTTGIVRGWKILEQQVKKTQGERTDVGSQETLFEMLAAERFEIALYSRHFGHEVIQQLGLSGIKTVEPPLASKEMYLFLHQKHQHLIPELTTTLQNMKTDGTFETIKTRTLIQKNTSAPSPPSSQTSFGTH